MWLLLSACRPSALDLPAAPERPARVASVPLTHADPAFVLPPSVRPDAVTTTLRPLGAFVYEEDRKRASVYKVRLPVAPDLLPTATRGTHTFGSTAPPGFVVTGPDGEVPFEWRGRKPGSWGFDEHWLYVGVPHGAPPPNAAEWSFAFPKATTAEQGMNLLTSGRDVDHFAVRTVTVGGVSHHGWLLPAPARATVELELPVDAVLGYSPGLLPPAVATSLRSDGATVVVTVRAGDVVTEVSRELAHGTTFAPVRVDLRRWAGRRVTLEFRVEPGEHNLLDYVFVEDPVVYVARERPHKVVVVFVDTLRADHLGFLGYERDTSPNLDRWAANAAVFDHARSVAPWTLPAARAALTGAQPEAWGASHTLATSFTAAGYRTDGIVSNAFLSQPFGIERGFSRFAYEHLAPPDDLVEYALRRLTEWPDRDQLVMVHFMGPHLPWEEPVLQRWRWAGRRPQALGAPTRGQISDIHPTDPDWAEVRDWVTARYDQNVRWVDAEVAALLERAGPDATVLLFSDHGEELWEHDGFEHGHQFGDELLRVPFAVKGPGIRPGRFSSPVSLLDVTPTLLDAAGLDVDASLPGRSVVPLTHGVGADVFANRPHGFGRPLYGDDGWGVVVDEHKWTARSGRQTLFDLAADPGEQVDQARGQVPGEYPDALARALDRPVPAVWRVVFRGDAHPAQTTFTASHPAGIARVWTAYDPRGRSAALEPQIVDGRATLVVPADAELPDAIYLEPVGDASAPGGLAVTVVGSRLQLGAAAAPDLHVPIDERSEVFLSGRSGATTFQVDLVHVPIPVGGAVSGFHEDVEQQLRDLGYLE